LWCSVASRRKNRCSPICSDSRSRARRRRSGRPPAGRGLEVHVPEPARAQGVVGRQAGVPRGRRHAGQRGPRRVGEAKPPVGTGLGGQARGAQPRGERLGVEGLRRLPRDLAQLERAGRVQADGLLPARPVVALAGHAPAPAVERHDVEGQGVGEEGRRGRGVGHADRHAREPPDPRPGRDGPGAAGGRAPRLSGGG
jgi:hypothetical protein